MEIPVGVQVWVPGTDLDACLKMAVDMWCYEEAHEVKCFVGMMREKKDGLYRQNGMSVTGNWKEYLEIPISLHKRIMQMTHKDYMLDRQITDRIKYFLQDIIPYEKKDESKVIV